jgi:hypothetical protein
MAQANSTNKSNVLRDQYGDALQEMTLSADPYRSKVKKDTGGFGGGPNVANGRIVVVRISQSVGTSHVYARALANKNPAAEARFVVLPKPIYHPFALTGLYIRQAKGKPTALIKGVEDEQKSAFRDLNKILDAEAWGNVGGSIGQIDTSTNLATNTLVFRNARALFGRYSKGQKIVFALDNGTAVSPLGLLGTGPDTPTILTILTVNESTNTITVGDVNGAATVLNSVPGITTAAFVFLDGFYAVSCSGKQGWNPITAPTPGENFQGVDRSVAPSFLSGWRTVSPGVGSMESTCIDAMTLGAQAETGTSDAFLNLFDWSRIVKEVGVKYVRDASDGKQGMGAKGLEVYGPRGSSTLVGLNLVPQGNAWMGEASADSQVSEGECPDVLDEDGAGMLRKVQNDDAYQGDLGGYVNFLPNDDTNKMGPGAWVIITWPTT